MQADQLRQYIIQPVLNYLGLYSASAEELLMMTAAQESHLGQYIHQLGNGPACGIFEMEPFTHDDIWKNYLSYHGDLADKVKSLNSAWRDIGEQPDAEEMIGNNFYACGMARVFYFRIPNALPPADQIEALAIYYKNHYNTAQGAATVPQVLDNYHRYVSAQ